MSILTALAPWWARIALCLALFAAGGVAGWTVDSWRLAAKVADAKVGEANLRADVSGRALAQARVATAQRDALAGKLSTLDAQASANLRKMQDENETLRAGVRAGTRVVRVAGAVCPERTADVPQAPAAGGVDSGAGAVLSADAGQLVYDLRARIIRTERKLSACQGAAQALTGQ